ncbi:hypothetical protein LTR53_011652 [Teratosphaeriaceae sp. CCFEE 6253]|nr:hypothetical protein LTR53_011652 [Teratosphaeriaceae sp. CCFEE 6253]
MATPRGVRFLYKILTAPPPRTIPRTLTAVDAADGFIHFSTAAQTPATSSRFFAAESSIWLVKIDCRKLEAGPGKLKWEASKSHGVFAHLYDADVAGTAVVEVVEKTRKVDEKWEDLLGGLEE